MVGAEEVPDAGRSLKGRRNGTPAWRLAVVELLAAIGRFEPRLTAIFVLRLFVSQGAARFLSQIKTGRRFATGSAGSVFRISSFQSGFAFVQPSEFQFGIR